MYPHHKDQEKFIAVARQGRQQLVEQMAKERQEEAEGSKHDTDPSLEPLPQSPLQSRD